MPNNDKNYSFNFIVKDNKINVCVNYKGNTTTWNNSVKLYDYFFTYMNDLDIKTFIMNMNKEFLKWCELNEKQTRATELLKNSYAKRALDEMTIMYPFLEMEHECNILDEILQHYGIIGYTTPILSIVETLLKYK